VGARAAAPARRGGEGFLFLVAREGERLAGFGYGYTGTYGQWWTDRVADAFTPELRAEWLDPPHFEVVELHVRPAFQRRGAAASCSPSCSRGNRTTAPC
jgi:hypothetical protein